MIEIQTGELPRVADANPVGYLMPLSHGSLAIVVSRCTSSTSRSFMVEKGRDGFLFTNRVFNPDFGQALIKHGARLYEQNNSGDTAADLR
jgi:hypothetical protein